MQDFKRLRVWQEAHAFVLDLYAATRPFPSDERYGLTNQLRRAAVSIPSNLAEDSSRGSDVDFARFVQIAIGSASEVEYPLLLAHDLHYLPDAGFDQLNTLLLRVRRMLMALLKSLSTPGS